MHSAQSMQRAGSMMALPPRTRMAWVGQRLMQLMHPLHSARFRVTEWMNSCFIPATFPHRSTFIWMVVPCPGWDSMKNSSLYRFMLGSPMPAPKPRLRTCFEAVL